MAPQRPDPFYIRGAIPTALAPIYFQGYEEERRTIIQALKRRSPTRLVVLGGRGLGKTSLVQSIIPDLPPPVITLNCHRIWPFTIDGFFRLVTESVGAPRLSIGSKPNIAQAYAGINVPKRATRGTLVLDNADDLALLDPDLLNEIPILAARIPFQLILTGESPLLAKVADHAVTLRPFSEATAADFFRRRLAQADLTIDDDALALVLELTKGHPSPLQSVGYAVWSVARNQASNRVSIAGVESAIFDVVQHLSSDRMTSWAAVRGIMKDVFVAMCLFDLTSPTAIADRLNVEPKSVIVLLGRLETAHRLVHRTQRGVYEVTDPFLKHYVRMEYGSPILR